VQRAADGLAEAADDAGHDDGPTLGGRSHGLHAQRGSIGAGGRGRQAARSVLAVGAATAVTGIIGFVGLIVPHIVRLLWGGDYRRLLPLSMILGAGLLLLADALYPGWQATVDGEPVVIYAADGLLRGVFVAEGAHEVVFTFRPRSLHTGAAVSLVGLFTVAMLALWAARLGGGRR